VIANNSHDFQNTDIHSYEYPWLKAKRPDRALPAVGNEQPSEVCDKIGCGWFWTSKENPANQETAEEVVAMLKLCNSRRANYLLNVAPDRSGLIHAYARQIAGADRDAVPLNQAVLDYCAAYSVDPEAAPTPYSDPRPSMVLYHLYLKPQYQRHLSPEARGAIEDVCWRWVYRHTFLEGPVDPAPALPEHKFHDPFIGDLAAGKDRRNR